MHLDTAGIELSKHRFDAPLDQGMVCPVAGDEFLDNTSQRRGQQLRVRDAHGNRNYLRGLSIGPLLYCIAVPPVFVGRRPALPGDDVRWRNFAASLLDFASRASFPRLVISRMIAL